MKYAFSILYIPAMLLALPSPEQVKEGSCVTEALDNEVHFHVSDKTVLEFSRFNIEEGEKVRFLQPNSKSTVLNRIYDTEPSYLKGSLEANGRVFFVNPQGVYIGPQAVIRTAAFLASTLDIPTEDFLKNKLSFSFPLNGGKIFHEGDISAEQFVILLAPEIEGLGKIVAHTDRVLLKTSGHVALDFSGDHLLQFEVADKFLSETTFSSDQGPIELTPKTAKDILQHVVNDDGIQIASKIEIAGGRIRLTAESEIKASFVSVQGEEIEIAGKIDASQKEEGKRGGRVEILGDRLLLTTAHIDVSGNLGGGTILVGGDEKGKGTCRNATSTFLDQETFLKADAYLEGDGGKVIVWADDLTLFYGRISACGGLQGGNGGKVETSGKERLGIGRKARVDTLAPRGTLGNWSLDPTSVTIVTGGPDALSTAQSPNCNSAASVSIDPSAFTLAGSTVTICSQNAVGSSITISNDITMTVSGAGLTLVAGSGSGGTINLGANITTNNGPLTFTGLVVLTASSTLTTAGGAISFSNTINATSAGVQGLSISTSGGAVTYNNNVGATTALGAFTATGSGAHNFNTSISTFSTRGGTINFANPITFNRSVTFASNSGLAAGADITFQGAVSFGSGNVYDIGINSGTSGHFNLSATFGSTTRPRSVSVSGARFNITGAITIFSGGSSMSLNSPIVINGSPTFNLAGGSLLIGSTVNGTTTGVDSLNINNNNLGTTSVSGIVGGTTPLKKITVTGSTPIAFGNAVNIQGDGTSNTGFAAVRLGTSTGGTAHLNMTAGGGIGADITVTSSLYASSSGNNIAFTAGVGTISLGPFDSSFGAVPNNVTINSAALLVLNNNISMSGALSSSATANRLGGTISINTSSGNGAISFSGPLNATASGTQGLTINAGSGLVTFSSSLGGTTPLGAVTITTSNASGVRLGGNLTTNSGAVTITGALTLLEGVNSVITTSGNQGVSVSGTTNGTAGTGGETLTIDASGGTVSLAAVGSGSSTSLTDLTITNSAAFTCSGAVNLTGSLIQTNAATGTTTFSNTVTLASATLRGIAYSINNSWTTSGATSITNSGTVTKNSTGTITATGGFSTTGAVNLASNITTTNTNLTVGGALTLAEAATPTLSCGSGTLTISGLTDGTAGGSAETLTLSAAGGAISLQAVGSGSATALTTLTVSNCNTISFNGIVNLTGAVAVTNASTATIGAAITANGGFSTTGPVTLGGNITTSNTALSIGGDLALPVSSFFVLTTAGGPLTISGATNGVSSGTGSVRIDTGTGSATFTGDVGNIRPLLDLAITNSGALSFAQTVTLAGGLTQTNAATGTTTFSNTVSVEEATLRGTSYTISNSWTSSGLTSFTNSGTVTKSSTGNITATGGFSTTGAVNLASNITTTNTNLTVGGALTLAEAATPTLSCGSGTLTISGLTDGTAGGSAETLTLSAAGGAISLQAVGSGSSTSLTTLTVSGCNTISFNGVVNLTGAVAVTNASTATIGAAITANGGFSTTGNLSSTANITTSNTPLSVGGNFTALNSIILTTGGGVATFSGLVNGNSDSGQSLTINTGAGEVYFLSQAGSIARLNILDITATGGFFADGNIYAAQIDIHAPITLAGSIIMNANINFSPASVSE